MAQVEESLKKHTKVTIKIQKSDKKQLNTTKEVIPIYYLSNEEGLVFDENDFEEGEKSSTNIYLIIFAIGFIVFLWAILRN